MRSERVQLSAPASGKRTFFSGYRQVFVLTVLVCCGLWAARVNKAAKSEPMSVAGIAGRTAQAGTFTASLVTRAGGTKGLTKPTTQAGSPRRVQVAQFTLYAIKIYPSEVHVHPGLIAVEVEDQSGGSNGLVIEQSNAGRSTRFGFVQRAVDSWRGRQEIELGPGTYQVYMADRPENRATLIVEP
ncbi:MAG TPA: hypothetical protein VGL29_18085 [Blastocatellia bacterium]